MRRLRKMASYIVYRLTNHRFDVGLDYWILVDLETRALYSLRDMRKTILKDTYAVKSGSYFDDMYLGGRIWR